MTAQCMGSTIFRCKHDIHSGPPVLDQTKVQASAQTFHQPPAICMHTPCFRRKVSAPHYESPSTDHNTCTFLACTTDGTKHNNHCMLAESIKCSEMGQKHVFRNEVLERHKMILSRSPTEEALTRAFLPLVQQNANAQNATVHVK